MTSADIAALRGLCEAAPEEANRYNALSVSNRRRLIEFYAAARSALPLALDRIEQLEREVNRARALLPTCSGTWLSGSGGHRRYAHDCAEPGIWDVGGRYVCDQHKNDKGSDDDAWQWHKERDLLVEMAGGDSAEIAAERVLLLTADRDRLRAEVERLAAERDADVANLRAGHCLAVIPETFIACGEGGSYCSETCRLRTLLAEAVEIGQRLAGLECDSAAEERLAAIAKEGLT